MASRSIPPASPPPEPGPGAGPGPGPGAGPGPGPTGLSVVVASRLLIVGLLGFGLVYLQSILIPLVFALLLSFVLLPAVRWLTRRKVPSGVAIMACLTAAMLPLTGLILFFISTAGPLSQEMPKYQDRLVYETNHLIDWAATRIGDDEARETVRRELTENLLPRILDEGARMAQRTLGTATAVLGAFALTLLLAGFCLAEAQRFREKFAEAYGGDHPLLDALKGIGHDVRAYLVAKTFISAVTGLCVGLFLWACGVDFAAFWGLLAFPLNFIPTVGAVVASLPPVLVALVDPALSGWMAFSVVVGLVAINGVIGAWLDPRYVGHAVKVSPLVVFGSMLVWGILWGPVGMILAVPIMVSVKVICARFPGLERIATLMKG
ncbi:MAG: AI-2E family transporter [Myxococcales bacterium]|nr:AI-2E family transporter [Myxococcales bacterium]